MFTFYFKENDLDAWQARLEKFKTSLVLILEVLNLRLLMKTAKDSSSIEDQRREISRLLVEESQARKTESLTGGQLQELLQHSNEAKRMTTEDSSSKATAANPPTIQGSNDISSPPQQSNLPITVGLPTGSHGSDQPMRNPPALTSAEVYHPPSLTAQDQERFDALRLCAESAIDLSAHVKLSISLWQQMQEAKHCGLIPSIAATKHFFPAINLVAQKLDIYYQHYEWTRSIIEGDPRPRLQIGIAAKSSPGFLGREGRFVHDTHFVAAEDPQLSDMKEGPQPQEDQDEGASAVKRTLDVDDLLRRWTILQA